jgi:hypothetical protein
MDQCVVQQTITCNGPAVEGVNVTRRSHPAAYPGTLAGICPGGEEGMAQFLPSRYKLLVRIYHYPVPRQPED